MRVEVDIFSNLAGMDVDEAVKKAVAATSQRALKDCNYYCKQDYGALIESSYVHQSDIENGVLRWTMPYAEYQYTFPSARKDKNPNASPEWCAKAESDFKDQWERVFADAINKEMKQ